RQRRQGFGGSGQSSKIAIELLAMVKIEQHAQAAQQGSQQAFKGQVLLQELAAVLEAQRGDQFHTANTRKLRDGQSRQKLGSGKLLGQRLAGGVEGAQALISLHHRHSLQGKAQALSTKTCA